MHGLEILRRNGFLRVPLLPIAAPSQGLGLSEEFGEPRIIARDWRQHCGSGTFATVLVRRSQRLRAFSPLPVCDFDIGHREAGQSSGRDQA